MNTRPKFNPSDDKFQQLKKKKFFTVYSNLFNCMGTISLIVLGHPPLLPSTNVGSCYFPVTEPYNRVLAWTDIDAISQGEDCFNTP